MANTESPYRYIHGLRDGIPIGLGYLSVSFGFGISAVGQGLRILEVLLISMTNLTSAGQVAGVAVIVAGGTLLEMILTQLVINLRYSLMGITLTQRLDTRCTTPNRMLMSCGLTDEIFALAAAKPYSIGPSYFYGLMTAPYVGWAAGTLLGAVAGNLLPADVRSAMGIMIYAMFVAIVLPPMKKHREILFTVVIAAACSCALRYIPILNRISSGFSIIISALLAAVTMALLRPITDENEGEENGDAS